MNAEGASCWWSYLSVYLLCCVRHLGKSSCYDWANRSVCSVSADQLRLNRRAKSFFSASRDSLGSRERVKKLYEEGFVIGRYAKRILMKWLNPLVQQRFVHKVATKRKHSDRVAGNLLNQNFKPVGATQV